MGPKDIITKTKNFYMFISRPLIALVLVELGIITQLSTYSITCSFRVSMHYYTDN